LAGVITLEECEALVKIEMVLIDACMAVDIEQGLRVMEAKVINDPPKPQLRVSGGLPQLPGTNIDAPDWNKKGDPA
jgi:hypothetical protein